MIASSTALTLWNEILDDMYGEEEARKITIYDMALKDDKVSQKAKEWLRSLLNAK
nr:hypothetical protein [Legionella tunisiensis]